MSCCRDKTGASFQCLTAVFPQKQFDNHFSLFILLMFFLNADVPVLSVSCKAADRARRIKGTKGGVAREI